MSDERLQMSKKQRLLALEEEVADINSRLFDFNKSYSQTDKDLSALSVDVEKLRKQCGAHARDIAALFKYERELRGKPMMPEDVRAVMASLVSLQTQIDDLKRTVESKAVGPLELEVFK